MVVSMRRPRHPVLVIEDHEGTRGAVERLLDLYGYGVVTANDGQEALDYLHRGGPACLIVLDVEMPQMDGRVFLERQLADPALARIPVVVFSGDPTSTPLPGAGFVRKMDPDGLVKFAARYCLKDE
jgi:CheY-like chemotaxis protein